MKKICIITQCSLPVPVTKGGAVETLVEYILKENEKNPSFEFTILGVGDLKAKELAKEYKYSNFVFIKEDKQFSSKIRYLFYRILKKIFKIYIPFCNEYKYIIKYLKLNQKFDYYLYEAGPTTQIPILSKYIPKDKFLVHLHWDGMATKKIDGCFSYLFAISSYIGMCWKRDSGCDSSKIKLLSNCANDKIFTKKLNLSEKIALKEKLNIPLENKVIIFTGRIVEEKGLKELLDAFSIIKSQEISLLIIGSANFGATTNTKYEADINRIIKQSNRSILFTGYIEQSELYKYYNIADIAVMPSIFQEPAGLVAIEAQMTGTPLIATNVGGISEYVVKEGTILIDVDENLVFNLANSIQELILDEDRCKYMSEINLNHIKDFNVKNYFINFKKYIDDLENSCD